MSLLPDIHGLWEKTDEGEGRVMSETVRSLPAVGLIADRCFFPPPRALSTLCPPRPQSSASVQPPPGDTQTFLFLISSPSANNGTVRLKKRLAETVFTVSKTSDARGDIIPQRTGKDEEKNCFVEEKKTILYLVFLESISRNNLLVFCSNRPNISRLKT